MATRLMIDGNTVYEIDEDCLERQQKRERGRETSMGKRFFSMNERDYGNTTEEEGTRK